MIKPLSLASAGLLLVLAAPWATALEMGNLITRSSLGQPYVGEIPIKGESHTQISPDCVRLSKPLQPNDLPGLPAGLSIEYRSGPQGGILHLTGKQKILDPALQVSVFIGCGINLQRDYVVMLDLPGQADRAGESVPAILPQTGLLTPTPPAARTAKPNRAAASVTKNQPAILSQPPVQHAVSKPHAAAPQELPVAPTQAETSTPAAPPADPGTSPTASTPASPTAPGPLPATTASDKERLITIGLIALITLLLIGIWYQHRRNILAAAREDYSRDGHPIALNTFLTQPLQRARAPLPAAHPKVAPPPSPSQPAKATEDDEMPALPATATSEYVMDLTDVMLSFGETKRALNALHDFVQEHPDNAVDPWLRLLELLRLHGKRKEFEALAGKLQQIFNIAPPEWEVADKAVASVDAASLKQATSLEDFNHIRQRLVDTWDSTEGLNYLDVLIRDNRSGQRRGFPLEIVEEAILLRVVLAMLLDKTRP